MRRNLWWAGSAVLMIAACSRSGPESAAALGDVSASDSAAPEAVAMAPAMAVGRGFADQAQTVPAAPTTERMIVRTATLSLQVADVRQAADAVTRATLAANGFLGASRLWRESTHERASITIRVPSTALDNTLAALRALAVRVDDEAVTGEDVTRQAVDLRARLTNLRATELELRALLATVRQKTGKASDVLEVHTELSRIRGEVEQADAELTSLTQLAALSTITLELRPDVVASPIAAETWQPRGVLRDAARALVGTLRVAVNGAIWAVVYVLPLFGAVGMVVVVAWRVVRQRRVVRSRPEPAV
jgi:hypothetical protein